MKNVTLDFTSSNRTEDIAMMPAKLAKKLLKDFAEKLTTATKDEIVNKHCEELQKSKSVQEAVELSIDWANERYLIEHVSKENWDIFKLQEP
jgi:hypothetical protein